MIDYGVYFPYLSAVDSGETTQLFMKGISAKCTLSFHHTGFSPSVTRLLSAPPYLPPNLTQGDHKGIRLHNNQTK